MINGLVAFRFFSKRKSGMSKVADDCGDGD